MQESNHLTPDEVIVVLVVASLPFSIPETPRPYTLVLLAQIAGISQRSVRRGLRNLGLLSVLSDSPDEALERANALLPRAMTIVKI